MNWIYCSERVPDHDNDVLVTVRTGTCTTFVAIDHYDGNEFYNYDDRDFAKVIAWAELPEPAEVKE